MTTTELEQGERTPKAEPVQEPESFEQWNAKQYGDPEEIGFLQALRIAYCSGQDSVQKATAPQASQGVNQGLLDIAYSVAEAKGVNASQYIVRVETVKAARAAIAAAEQEVWK
jgi:hypothetical protein